MRRRILRIAIIFGLLSAFLTAISLQPAVAAGVVGDGTPASCTEAALDNALAGGGSVTFNCGLVQTSINLTATKVIANDTQIDGDGLIVLDMNDIDRHFYVAPTAILRLTDIWLEDGSTAGDGGLIRNDGTVIASNVSFRDGRALGLGGAIRNEGTLVAMGGIFTTNFSDQAGGAIFNGPSASATISGDTRLISNRSQFANGGAIANRGGTVGISGNLEFISNIAANGGGIVNALGGSVSIDGATFSRNQAVTDGGAIHNANGAVKISSSTFHDNEAFNSGGALSQGGIPTNISTISGSWFDLNTSSFQGGAIHNESGLSVDDTEFSFNHADNSGGVINNAVGANLIVTRSALVYNDAVDRGGGIRNGGTVTLETSTVSNNTADNQGGGLVNQDGMAINNSTIAFNDSGAQGGGIRNAPAGTRTVTNSIVSDNTGGGDCSNSGTFNSGDNNLDSDSSCPFGMANDI